MLMNKMVTAAAASASTTAAFQASGSASFVSLCGKLAPLGSVLLCMAPLPTIFDIEKKRSVGGLPLLPYSSLVANCFIWTTYGILKKESKIWSCNALGFVLGLYYMLRFIRFSPKASPSLPGSVRQHVQAVAAIILATLITALSPISKKVSAKIIGMSGVTMCMLLFASPLAALKSVLETKSAASIALPMSVATAFSCMFWTVAGVWQMADPNVWLPNAVGMFFGVVQLLLKLTFGDGIKQAYAGEKLPM